MVKEHKLDNPAWNSLNEIHETFSIEYQAIKFYNPAYCPFGGAIDKDMATQGISEYSSLSDSFFVIGEKPLLNDSITLKRNLICNQMLLKTQIKMELGEEIIALKDENQRQDLFNLVSLVQPGYFKKRTVELGRYFGIYKGNKLVAASGERMKMNDFTEISAIVTHPEHTRKGYAKQLIKYTTDQVFQENKMPYLHVVESNIHAIKLYEKLGFTTRRKISFWNLSLKINGIKI
ncbi:MAG: GNAT family N-acetyltransferase [Chitinophagales bacterium]